ncbi:MAG: Rdx family protein [Candidatus Dormibacteraeota bacterium]|nr:Rdx family protein [Candidatus Dormibacteraeota bacterium]
MSLAGDLLSRWAPIMRSVELQSGAGGAFEITLDSQLLFSKKAAGRFPKPGEVAELFEKKLGPALTWR